MVKGNKVEVKSVEEAKKPILVLGWGEDGCKDIDCIEKALGYDQSLDCVTAKYAESCLVEQEVGTWLRDHPNAQTLYLGAHGHKEGLVPTRHSRDKLDYRTLGRTIVENVAPTTPPLTVILGACESSVAAEVWNNIDHNVVRLLIAFPARIDKDTVQGVLTEFLMQGDLLKPGKTEVENELIYLEVGIARLRKNFPEVTIYFNEGALRNVKDLPESGDGSLLHILERRGAVKPGSLLWELVDAAMRLPDTPGEEASQPAKPSQRRRPPRWLGPTRKPKIF
jgi:hypothetical protein